jgi:hypothetical protein
VANRITSAAKIAVTGKTPGDRRAEFFEQLARAEAHQVAAAEKRRTVLIEAEALGEKIAQAQVDAMRTGDETELDELLDRRDELVGAGGPLLGHFSKIDGLDNGLPASGLLAEARRQHAVATRAIHEIGEDLRELHRDERGWFRREAEAQVTTYREHVRLAASALADAVAMEPELRDLCSHVVVGHRQAGYQDAGVLIGDLTGARAELDGALESTGFTGLN